MPNPPSDPLRHEGEEREGVAIGIRSGLSVRTRRPFVELQVGEQVIELECKAALEIAMSMVFAATAGISEGTLVEFAGGDKLTTEEVGDLLERLGAARAVVNSKEGISE